MLVFRRHVNTFSMAFYSSGPSPLVHPSNSKRWPGRVCLSCVFKESIFRWPWTQARKTFELEEISNTEQGPGASAGPLNNTFVSYLTLTSDSRQAGIERLIQPFSQSPSRVVLASCPMPGWDANLANGGSRRR